METLSLRRFLAHYFPTFIGGFFAAVVSISCGVPLVGDHYFPTATLGQVATGMYIACMALGLVVVHCNFMIVRGYPQWVRGLVLVFVVCFLSVLPTITSHPHRVIYALAIFAPLLGVLLLNSKRHREMRERLVEIRKQRESLRRTLPRRR
ncbi:hypothetical protein [Pseudomonas vanderleydeniana]|uniref:Lipoprotein n=1 Tax=Pseudomonas vanderleydeniana TaxID=2745495 RepID=A0A9E6TS04_9PSED|nr:hypothetical protein [Pseudomonas vanderleydeniana]QXI29083.1 hypothetical protein HU752_003710 [Pseudomonas vanderleydeniana]